ncbi:MAG: cysteine synthase [Desulfovibrionaceae bacterium]
MIHDSILSTVGRTPLVTLAKLTPNPRVKILAKVESGNPGGSIKDRVALAMIEAAERSGELTPDKTVIEATSGNTGIGLAMVCAVKGYKITLLMPETASLERRRIMQAYGAQIVLTPGHLATDGAIEEAYRLAREEPDTYVLMDQYNNAASIDAHYMGTGLEIWEQTQGRVTHVVMTLGTSGTAMGITKRLKEMNPAIQICAMEPYAGHKIQGLKNMQESYPPGIYDKKVLDRVLRVEDEEAFDMCRQLARREGIFAGMSSGAAVAAACNLARELDSGVIVAILPDGGERYLSTPLFAPAERQGPVLHDVGRSRPVRIAPSPAPAGLFTMGPPLDNLDEVDSWRRIVLLDILARHMNAGAADGALAAKVAVGLADMDDRALEALDAARHAGQAGGFVDGVVQRVGKLAESLGVASSVAFVPAGGCTATALDVCRKLLAKGAAYEKLRSVYFDVLRFDRYGAMSAMDMDKLSLGKTVDLSDYVKSNPKDFTLLKRATLADLKKGDCLQTEWGNVRPSWFLQHAAAAMDTLGRFAVFMASEGHRFPHLENFRAILALGRNKEPEAWLLCQPSVCNEPDAACSVPGVGALLADGGLAGRAVRMWLLSTSYRKPLLHCPASLAMWSRNWDRVQNLAAMLSETAADATGRAGGVSHEVSQSLVDLKAGLKEAMEDDLGLHKFWPVLFTFCRETQQRHGQGVLNRAEAEVCLDKLRGLDGVLGILDETRLPVPPAQWTADVAALVAARQAARQARDFARADALRGEIAAAGFRVEDGPQGARLFRTVC